MKKQFNFLLMPLYISIFIGIVTALFTHGLSFVSNLRDNLGFQYFIFLLPFAGLLSLFLYDKFAKNYDRGMAIILENLDNKDVFLNYAMGILVFFTTLIAHLFGASVGREGVAVQLGGVIAKKNSSYISENREIFSRVGMACGFAGLFQTPLAATLFIYEITNLKKASKDKKILYFGLAIFATFISKYTAKLLGAHSFLVNIDFNYEDFSFVLLKKIFIATVLFGILGFLFAQTTDHLKKLFNHIFKNKYLKIFIVSAILSVIFFVLKGRYLGLGLNLIHSSFFDVSNIQDKDFILKLLLTCLCLSIGFQGGEVTPIFAIGASAGIFISRILGADPLLIAALGYICVFSSATHGFLGSAFIGAEIFGFKFLPIFLAACFIAKIINFHKNIYGRKLDRELFSL